MKSYKSILLLMFISLTTQGRISDVVAQSLYYGSLALIGYITYSAISHDIHAKKH